MVAKLVDYVMAVFLDVIDDPLGFVEFRELLRKKSEADGLTDGYGSETGGSWPAMTRSSVDLPTPFPR